MTPKSMPVIPTSAPRRGTLRASHLRQVSNGSSESPYSSRPLTSASEASTAQYDHMPLKPPVERRCQIWVHDEAFSREEVVLNLDLFPDVKAGDLMAIVALKTDSGVRDFQDKVPKRDSDNLATSMQRERSNSNPRSPSQPTGADTKHDLDMGKRYLFVAKDMPKEMLAKHPSLEVSITKSIADVFCFKHRSSVLLTTVHSHEFTLDELLANLLL